MKTRFKTFKISDIFRVQSGDFHSVSDMDPGVTPLISCGDLNNGVVGYFDIPVDKTYSRALTVAYNGSWPLTTKFHSYEFGSKDDVAVLVPLHPLKDSVLLYIAALLNREIWRYSYGRKCFKEKLASVEIRLPVNPSDSGGIDSALPDELFATASNRVSNGAVESAEILLGRG